jgi:hypothetical protein
MAVGWMTSSWVTERVPDGEICSAMALGKEVRFFLRRDAEEEELFVTMDEGDWALRLRL